MPIFHWLPGWLDEGLAEFYGYTRFERDKMYIGAPPRAAARVEFLQEKNTIPLAKFIKSRIFSRDEEQTQLSYMQAWGLTHYLTFGPGMQNGGLLKRFFNELQRGVEQQKAFVETFGSLDDVQARYEQYLKRFAFPAATLTLPQHVEESDYTARNMTLAETHAEMAAWHIRFHHWEQVRELAAASLNEDPKLSLAHEDNGFLQFNEGKDDDAIKEFSAAVSLDPKNYIALFAQIMTSSTAHSNDPKDRDATYHALEGVLDLKPDFAPAYVELAKIAISKRQMPLALGLSRKAEQLEPFRSGYHVLTGEILLRMNRPKEAAEQAAYVAQRWGGSDRDEALESLNAVPPEDRPAESAATVEIARKWLTATGIVKSVTCDGHTFGITLEINGQPQTFKSTGFPVGFSDTLWVGHDHFSPCFHVQGLRAMLRYNPSKDPSYAGDLIYVGFRDDLGLQVSPATTQASAH
jgi:tetratricopeptide (TPR) repeat protein